MLKSLYSKMLAWLLLNLLLIALVGGGFVFFVLFSNIYGLVPASLFSSNVENVFRVLSTELQYRSTQEWSAIVKAYDRPGLQFHLVSLDDPWLYFAGDFVPLAILETAQRIPRTPFTLCPDPSKVFRGSEDYQTETGLAPTPPAIFARQGSPTGYWYARTLFVPDANHEAHYLLLAVESDDFTGQELFFNFRLALFVVYATNLSLNPNRPTRIAITCGPPASPSLIGIDIPGMLNGRLPKLIPTRIPKNMVSRFGLSSLFCWLPSLSANRFTASSGPTTARRSPT